MVSVIYDDTVDCRAIDNLFCGCDMYYFVIAFEGPMPQLVIASYSFGGHHEMFCQYNCNVWCYYKLHCLLIVRVISRGTITCFVMVSVTSGDKNVYALSFHS